jgi:hypothetical protein
MGYTGNVVAVIFPGFIRFQQLFTGAQLVNGTTIYVDCCARQCLRTQVGFVFQAIAIITGIFLDEPNDSGETRYSRERGAQAVIVNKSSNLTAIYTGRRNKISSIGINFVKNEA